MSLVEYSDMFTPVDDKLWEKTKVAGSSVLQPVRRDKVQMTPSIPSKYPHSSLILQDGVPPHFNYGFDSGENRFANMVISQSSQPLNRDQHWMVDHIGKLLLPKMDERYNFYINPRNRLRNVIRFMLHHNSSDVVVSTNDFIKYKWFSDDIYRLAIIQHPASIQNISHYLYNYENIFADNFSDCLAFYFDKYIVMVFHGESCNLKGENLNILEKQLEIDNATCCIGLKFCDFHNIHTHYYYTVDSFRLLTSDSRIQYLEAIHLQNVIAMVNSVLPLPALCHYAAVLISRCDKENGTDLLLTLETYLANNKSLIESANILFVHKSTISYRLKCIERIVPINYDNPHERLNILASCIILRCFDEIRGLK